MMPNTENLSGMIVVGVMVTTIYVASVFVVAFVYFTFTRPRNLRVALEPVYQLLNDGLRPKSRRFPKPNRQTVLHAIRTLSAAAEPTPENQSLRTQGRLVNSFAIVDVGLGRFPPFVSRKPDIEEAQAALARGLELLERIDRVGSKKETMVNRMVAKTSAMLEVLVRATAYAAFRFPTLVLPVTVAAAALYIWLANPASLVRAIVRENNAARVAAARAAPAPAAPAPAARAAPAPAAPPAVDVAGGAGGAGGFDAHAGGFDARARQDHLRHSQQLLMGFSQVPLGGRNRNRNIHQQMPNFEYQVGQPIHFHHLDDLDALGASMSEDSEPEHWATGSDPYTGVPPFSPF